jgi:thermitase
VQTSPLRYLASGAAVGAAAAALVVGLTGPAGSESGSAAAGATADVVGTVGKPVKPLKRNVVKPLRKKARPRPPVAAAEPARPNDPLWGDSWSLSKVHAPAAWRLTSGTAETVVAVLDTGVDRTHGDLQGSFVDGWDAVNEDNDPADDHGHGTLVAGVVAARSNNGIGGVGACPRCSLMPVKVIGANGAGNAADIAEGIRWAADHGAEVINMSFALTGPDDGVAAAIAYAQSRGALVVAAAGNAGTADVTFPAAYPGVLGVTATDQADERYSWSSYGGWVRLAAPGCSVSTGAGGTYSDFCGTSSATALVSGLAALIRSYAPAMTVDELGQALAANALRVGDFVSAGRVDVEAAVGSLTPARPASDPIDSSTPGADQRD